ncbi:MAG: CDGSH iron-sulfur domain-containing protein [Burkholderiales bacterium]|nr:CDGSH iron-sulfur domain-containing protein [Burkholderiales bacterium]
MNVIVVHADGPYHCSGALELRSADSRIIATPSEAWLCRCGLSRDKPYCDGSHAQAGLAAEPLSVGSIEPEQGAGVLRIRTRKDGPLKLEGGCEVRTEDGKVLLRGNETALCRCGSSKRKPFCDGTHREVGFEAG